MEDPTKSPLPLIGPNAVGDLLAPTTSGFPYTVTTYCDPLQINENQFSTALKMRLIPAINPYDRRNSRPETVHEALFMNGAIGTCNPPFFPVRSSRSTRSSTARARTSGPS